MCPSDGRAIYRATWQRPHPSGDCLDLPAVGPIESLLRAMRSCRCARLRVGDLELELHASAFVAAPAPERAEPDNDKCNCTHSLLEQHSEAGCLLGCSAHLCAPEEARA